MSWETNSQGSLTLAVLNSVGRDWSAHLFAGAAISKHNLGAISHRKWLPHCLAGQNCQSKVSAGLIPSGGHKAKTIPAVRQSLACLAVP